MLPKTALSDNALYAMEKRRTWINSIGAIFKDRNLVMPQTSIYEEEQQSVKTEQDNSAKARRSQSWPWAGWSPHPFEHFKRIIVCVKHAYVSVTYYIQHFCNNYLIVKSDWNEYALQLARQMYILTVNKRKNWYRQERAFQSFKFPSIFKSNARYVIIVASTSP